ncbi:cytochrome P450 [Amylostereum chailletii]|nr:cytochrome P450 [Amylostereum chailletii]
MYPIGIQPLFEFLWYHCSTHGALPPGFAVVALILYSYAWFNKGARSQAIAILPGFFAFNLTTFFHRRFDFLISGFHVTGRNAFQFRLLRNHVIVVSGEQGRRDFFNARSLDLQEGFRVLSGALPFVQGVTSDLRQRRIAQIYKRLAHVQRNDRLNGLIHLVLRDCHKVTDSWGASGIHDPFKKTYELVFQTTVRCLTAAEIADDPALVARLRDLYDQVDRGTTPATVLFPWFPSPAMFKKLRATKEIYDIVVAAVKVRRQSKAAQDDSLQMLLDAGEDPRMIVGFIMGLLIAGARSTGTIASWMITFVGCHPTWREAALKEIQQLAVAHAHAQSPCTRALNHRHSDALLGVPLCAWESETPVLDALIRETLRIAQPHVAMRRNVGPDSVFIDGNAVPPGAFVVYPFSDVHLNEELYPDPWKFDPGRPVTKGDLSYIGWGGGRVNCLGTRLAKLEIKLITAVLLLDFEFTTVDSEGRMADPPPRPNWNDILSCRPSHGSYSFQYARRESPTA